MFELWPEQLKVFNIFDNTISSIPLDCTMSTSSESIELTSENIEVLAAIFSEE